MELPQKIGFIGAGQMAEALARGFIAQGITSPAKISCTDPNAGRRELFQSFGAKAVEGGAAVSARARHPESSRPWAVMCCIRALERRSGVL